MHCAFGSSSLLAAPAACRCLPLLTAACCLLLRLLAAPAACRSGRLPLLTAACCLLLGLLAAPAACCSGRLPLLTAAGCLLLRLLAAAYCRWLQRLFSSPLTPNRKSHNVK